MKRRICLSKIDLCDLFDARFRKSIQAVINLSFTRETSSSLPEGFYEAFLFDSQFEVIFWPCAFFNFLCNQACDGCPANRILLFGHRGRSLNKVTVSVRGLVIRLPYSLRPRKIADQFSLIHFHTLEEAGLLGPRSILGNAPSP